MARRALSILGRVFVFLVDKETQNSQDIGGELCSNPVSCCKLPWQSKSDCFRLQVRNSQNDAVQWQFVQEDPNEKSWSMHRPTRLGFWHETLKRVNSLMNLQLTEDLTCLGDLRRGSTRTPDNHYQENFVILEQSASKDGVQSQEDYDTAGKKRLYRLTATPEMQIHLV
jgi:hypothetical protein